MRESVKRELLTWAQYLTIGSLANISALFWQIGRVNWGSDNPLRWAGVIRQWSETYFVPWLVFFTVLSLIRVIILFFLAMMARDREQSISRRSW